MPVAFFSPVSAQMSHRLGKSAAFFDKQKLLSTNAHYLKELPQEELQKAVGQFWVEAGLLHSADSPFVRAAADLLASSLKIVPDAEKGLRDALGYPLHETLQSEDGQALMSPDIAREILEVGLLWHGSSVAVRFLPFIDRCPFQLHLTICIAISDWWFEHRALSGDSQELACSSMRASPACMQGIVSFLFRVIFSPTYVHES